MHVLDVILFFNKVVSYPKNLSQYSRIQVKFTLGGDQEQTESVSRQSAR